MKKAVVAVSGGSDSLALLDILFHKKAYELVVCHVNYNYRDSSIRDEKLVKEYCDKNKIKCYILNVNSKEEKSGNFEDWARVKRYKFFKEIYDKENCDCLFVGHHKEDCLETYLLQKERGAIVECYGLAQETNLQGMKVIRPLLEYNKKDLEKYCLDNGIVYGIDETNFDLSYKRNKIRHGIIASLSEEEKQALLEEMKEKNTIRKQELERVNKYKKECLKSFNVLDLKEFNKLELEVKKEVLYYFLIDNIYHKISIKKSRIEDLIKKINSEKPNIVLASYDNFTLYKEYDCLVIDKNNEDYSYVINDLTHNNIGNSFSIKSEGKKLEKVRVSKKMFPLYITNYKGDNKSVNRLFIDKKVPLRKRKSWPIIVDKFGGLLLVIGIKKFYNEESQNIDNDIIEFYVCEN